MTETKANAAQIDFWNSAAGEHWVKSQESMDKTLAGFGDLAIKALNLESGAHILDIGCGCGGTSLSLASANLQGTVTGVDISAPMLARSAQRKAELELDNVKFLQADAATYSFDSQYYDAVFSRFGVMFFDNPVNAFKNIRTGLKAGAKLSFVCWRPALENQWMMVPMMAALEHIERPELPAANAPGPFAFGDSDYTSTILKKAGFSNVSMEPMNLPMVFSIAENTSLGQQFAEMGPVGRLIVAAPEEQKNRIVDSITQALQIHIKGNNVEMEGSVWLVAADN